MWRHDPYTSEQALIIRLYLCCELSIISILSFINSVQDDLPQVSTVNPIGSMKTWGKLSCTLCINVKIGSCQVKQSIQVVQAVDTN